MNMKNRKTLLTPIRVTMVLCFSIWIAGCTRAPERLTEEDFLPDVSRGKDLVSVYACSACHEIAGVSGIPGNIGPPLTEWGQRKFIAGRVPNEAHILAQWIQNPQEFKPGTAMPDLGVSKVEALSMAAYLYSQ